MNYQYAPYSYSKLALFSKCPYQWKLKYIDNVLPITENKILERGKFFHHCLECYPKTIEPFEFKFANNNDITQWQKEINSIFMNDTIADFLLKYRLKSEYEFNLDRNFKKIKEKENALLHGFIDYIGQVKPFTLDILDWKTGHSIANNFQLKFYALWALSVCDNINDIYCRFFYLDQNTSTTLTYHRDDYDMLKNEILDIINKIESTTEFEKTRNQYCEFCPEYKNCSKLKRKEK